MEDELEPELLVRLQRLTQQARARRAGDEVEAPGAQLAEPLEHLRNQRAALAADGESAPDFPDSAGAASDIERFIVVIEQAQAYIEILETQLKILLRQGVPQAVVEAQAAHDASAPIPPLPGSGITAL
jgi:hypothetical protein